MLNLIKWRKAFHEMLRLNHDAFRYNEEGQRQNIQSLFLGEKYAPAASRLEDYRMSSRYFHPDDDDNDLWMWSAEDMLRECGYAIVIRRARCDKMNVYYEIRSLTEFNGNACCQFTVNNCVGFSFK